MGRALVCFKLYLIILLYHNRRVNGTFSQVYFPNAVSELGLIV